MNACMQVSMLEAMDVFYHSYTYEMMRQGIADMHCQGEFYLVEEILDELKVAQGSDEQ